MIPDRFARAVSELANLRPPDACEPDYDTPGIAAAYAVRYLPHRITSVVAALILSRRPVPQYVLDVGSGSGATAIALRLLYPETAIRVVSLDPSQEMADFRHFYELGEITSPWYRRSVTDLQREDSFGKRMFDAIVMSACLPYNFFSEVDWHVICRNLYQYSTDSAAVIAIEPDAKQDLLSEPTKAFRSHGGYTVEELRSHAFAAHLVKARPMRKVTEWLRAVSLQLDPSQLTPKGRDFLGHPEDPYSVDSWNWATQPEHYDAVRIYRKHV